MTFLLQDPDDTVKYSIDWTGWIPSGESITSAMWSVSPSGPTVTDQGEVDNVSTAQMSGVVFGEIYSLTCKATLSTGEDISQSIAIRGGHK